MPKEVFDETTQTWVSEDDESLLQRSYDYLEEKVPQAIEATTDFVSENARTAGDALSEFFYGPKPIPTLSGDLNAPEAVPPMDEQLRRAAAAEAVSMPGAEAMAIGAAREAGKLKRGIQDISDTLGPIDILNLPGMLMKPGGAERKTKRATEAALAEPILEQVEEQRPWMHGTGATSLYMMPGINAPLKAAQVGGIPTKSAARTLYDVGEKIPGKWGQRVKGAGVDLALLPKRIEQSPFANTLALGAGVGAIHPEMTAGEGGFYAGAGYGLGKAAYGKFGKPKNYNLPEKNELIKWGKSKGYDIDPGVQTGDIRFQQLDQAFFRNADTAGPFQQARLKNRDLNNRVVSRFVGRETNNISDEWFESTGRQLKARSNELYNQMQPTHNPQLRRRTDNLLKDFEDVFGGQNIPGQKQYNPNWDPAFKKQVDKVWKLFDNPADNVPLDAWKGVRGSLDKVTDSFARRQDKAHLVPYLDELSDILDGMLEGSANKQALAQLKRNKIQRAVRWHAMATQKVSGEIDMKHLGNVIGRKYPSQIRGIQSTGNEKLDDFYNAIKLDKAMSDVHGASLGVSDRVSRLFTNPASRATGRLGYLFSKNAHEIGRLNSAIINAYRKSPQMGLPSGQVRRNLGMGPITMDEMVGAISGRYALSEQ